MISLKHDMKGIESSISISSFGNVCFIMRVNVKQIFKSVNICLFSNGSLHCPSNTILKFRFSDSKLNCIGKNVCYLILNTEKMFLPIFVRFKLMKVLQYVISKAASNIISGNFNFTNTRLNFSVVFNTNFLSVSMLIVSPVPNIFSHRLFDDYLKFYNKWTNKVFLTLQNDAD